VIQNPGLPGRRREIAPDDDAMVAVAVVAAAIASIAVPLHRRWSFESLGAYHQSKGVYGYACSRTSWACIDCNGKVMTPDEAKLALWHMALAEKYRQAAAHPWLPVEPDPPEPGGITSGASGG
jgi:hypothetical protein